MNFNTINWNIKKIYVGLICALMPMLIMAGDFDTIQKIKIVLKKVYNTPRNMQEKEYNSLMTNAKTQIREIIKNQEKMQIKKIMKNWEMLIHISPMKISNPKEKVLLDVIFSNFTSDNYFYMLSLAIDEYKIKKMRFTSLRNIYARGIIFAICDYKSNETQKLIKYMIIIFEKNNELHWKNQSIAILNGQSFLEALSIVLNQPSKIKVKDLKGIAIKTTLGNKTVFSLTTQILAFKTWEYLLENEPKILKKVNCGLIHKKCTLDDIINFFSKQPEAPNNTEEKLKIVNNSFRLANSGLLFLIEALSNPHLSLDKQKIIIDVITSCIYSKEQVRYIISLLNDTQNNLSGYLLKKLSEKLLKTSNNISKQKIITFLKKNTYMK